MQPQSSPTYTLSPQLLAREDFRTACHQRDFGEVFRLMRKYEGVSQDKMSAPIDGLGQSRISRIMNNKERITSVEVMERIADALRIPGDYFRLAPRAWEAATPPADLSVVHDTPPTVVREPAGELIDRRLSLDIDVAPDGSVTLNYRQELFNGGTVPFTRLTRELWFEHTSGPLTIEALPLDQDDENARNLIIKKIHQSTLNAHYACQVFPAVQPGESATIAYTCTGGRFVDAFYWRQSVLVPTQELRMRLVHHGIRQLTECAGIEERADGSELSVADSIAWSRTDDAVVVELARTNLAINQALTLRWDFARATA
jgi:transcriptional regulator with XRE-family HTH domain